MPAPRTKTDEPTVTSGGEANLYHRREGISSMMLPDVTRRDLLGSAATGLATVPFSARADETSPAPPQVSPATEPQNVTLQVNGQTLKLSIEPRTTLLDALREYAALTGTKKGCDMGSCGACTVHINGRRVLSCLTLAIRCQGQAITTIEGLAINNELHPVQAAFVQHDAFQCGYCTPGQIMSAVALINEGHVNSPAEVREWMSGNICRCGAYPNIVDAIHEAATRMQEG